MNVNTDQLMTLAVNKNGFIFDPENGISYTVNETGLFILQQMQKGQQEQEIIASLCEEYEVLPDQVRSDLEHYCAMLKSLNLVED